MSKQPFIVRTWSVDSAEPPVDRPRDRLKLAIEEAALLAGRREIRSAMVTDLHSTVFAQFNMLWSVPEELR